MAVRAVTLALSLLSVSVHPFLIDGPSPMFPIDAASERSSQEAPTPYSDRRPTQEAQEEPWSEMTIIKTHYDCRGFPMWKEVSRIKSRAGESVEVVKTSKETFDGENGRSATSEKPEFFKSMKSRLRVATRKATATTTAATTALSTAAPRPRPRPMGRELVEVGPDRVIDTPIISCPEGYNEDYNGRCRPVFPEPY